MLIQKRQINLRKLEQRVGRGPEVGVLREKHTGKPYVIALCFTALQRGYIFHKSRQDPPPA